MLGDLRAQINMQGEQIKNQAQQIQNLQEKETENIKVINLQQRRERHYLNEIKDLKATIKNLESKLESIQNQISNEQS